MRARHRLISSLVVVAGLGCGGSSSDGTIPDDDATVDAGDESGFDVAGDGAKADGTTTDVVGGDAVSDAPCTDTTSDPKNCGACGTVCGTGQSCSAGKCVCPPYQALCAGACIPVVTDPKNCGGCGVTCPAGQVCSAGACSSTCLVGTKACAGSCVDIATDSANCGTCGTRCAAGTGCVGGVCKPSAPLGPPPAKCVDGGPPIPIDGTPSAPCSGAVSAKTFTWAVCSCKDVKLSSRALVDGFDSTKGPNKPGELGGGLAANGIVTASSETDVWGQLWSAGPGTMLASSKGEVHHDLQVGGPMSVGEYLVDKDAYVVGAITASDLRIIGALHHPAGAAISGKVTQGSLVTGPVKVAQPCACDAKDVIPVSAIVAAHKTANDDAAVGLDPAIFTKVGHPDRLDLPCGQYYLNGFTLAGAAAIVAHGHTALYIDGDLDAGSFLSITLDPTATLDVFVSGTIRASAQFQLGNANYPAIMRTYVGGSATLTLTSNVIIASNLYDAAAKVMWTSDTDVFGAIFAGDFESTAPLTIHYDRQVVKTGDECPPPKPPRPPPTDAGVTDTPPPPPPPGLCGQPVTACASCRDCGNQACVGGKCGGACTSNADCCAPLNCVAGCCVSPIR